jgi:hypothetical protein
VELGSLFKKMPKGEEMCLYQYETPADLKSRFPGLQGRNSA